MNILVKTVLLALIIVIMSGGGNLCYAGGKVVAPIVSSLEPDLPMIKNAPITLHLTYAMNPDMRQIPADTGSFSVIFVTHRDRSDTISQMTYPVNYDMTFAFYDILQKYSSTPIVKGDRKSESYTGTFQVTLPDADTCCLLLHFRCGRSSMTYRYFFTASGDEVEYFDNYFIPPEFIYEIKALDRQNVNREIDRDTLTWTQLQTKLDMAIDLRKKEHYDIVKEMLGDIPDSCRIPELPGQYIINMTMEQAYKLYDMGFRLEESRGKRYKRIGKDQPEKMILDDSLKDQGNLEFDTDGFSIDSVVPLTPSGCLPTDSLITFYIHIKNTDGIRRFGIQNGFRIYSMDGATWNSIFIDTVALEWDSWDEMFDFGVFMEYYSANGYGADTVAFGGVAFYGGMPGYFDETSYSITIGPIDDAMDGKEICLDSSFFLPAGDWMWSDEAGTTSKPPWAGERCFTIERTSTITYSGHLYYMDPFPPDTNQMPMRQIEIQMWDDDGIMGQDSLATMFTDDTGYFSFGPIENDDMWGGFDIFLRYTPKLKLDMSLRNTMKIYI